MNPYVHWYPKNGTTWTSLALLISRLSGTVDGSDTDTLRSKLDRNVGPASSSFSPPQDRDDPKSPIILNES